MAAFARSPTRSRARETTPPRVLVTVTPSRFHCARDSKRGDEAAGVILKTRSLQALHRLERRMDEACEGFPSQPARRSDCTHGSKTRVVHDRARLQNVEARGLELTLQLTRRIRPSNEEGEDAGATREPEKRVEDVLTVVERDDQSSPWRQYSSQLAQTVSEIAWLLEMIERGRRYDQVERSVGEWKLSGVGEEISCPRLIVPLPCANRGRLRDVHSQKKSRPGKIEKKRVGTHRFLE